MATISGFDNKKSSFIVDITFSDTGTFSIGNLPSNSLVTDIKVFVSTAFDSGTSDSLSIGIGAYGSVSADSDYFETAVDLQSAGNATLTKLNQLQVLEANEPVPLTGTISSNGSAVSAGVAHIEIEYIQK